MKLLAIIINEACHSANMCHNINVTLPVAALILLTVVLWLRIVQEQHNLRKEVMGQVAMLENKRRGEVLSENIKDDKVEFSELESRFNKRLEEIEKKVNYKFKDEIVEWSKSLVNKGSKTFSQNDEDGVIEAVFDFIETTDKVYVEFGVESCVECNSRYLRWDL